MLSLYDHQQELVERVRARFTSGARSVLIQLPTGGGKTVIASHIIKGSVGKGRRTLFVAHRTVLVQQAGATLESMGLRVGYIVSGRHCDPDADVYVGMVMTLRGRLAKGVIQPFDTVFIDEAHHATAGTYQAVISMCPDALIIGLTATPERADGSGLGDVFQVMERGKTAKWLIDNGYLCPFVAFGGKDVLNASRFESVAGDVDSGQVQRAIEQGKLVGLPCDKYIEHAEGTKAIVFSVNTTISKAVSLAFNQRGIASAHLDGKDSEEQREFVLKSFRRGGFRVLCNVDLFGEGFDVPDAETAILFRPTNSLSLHIQQCGRVLRYNPAKPGKIATIIDIANNCKTHHLPDYDHDWELVKGQSEDIAKKKLAKPLITVACKSCNKMFSAVAESVAADNPLCTECYTSLHSGGDAERLEAISDARAVTAPLPLVSDTSVVDVAVRGIYDTLNPKTARQLAIRHAKQQGLSPESARLICDNIERELR